MINLDINEDLNTYLSFSDKVTLLPNNFRTILGSKQERLKNFEA